MRHLSISKIYYISFSKLNELNHVILMKVLSNLRIMHKFYSIFSEKIYIVWKSGKRHGAKWIFIFLIIESFLTFHIGRNWNKFSFDAKYSFFHTSSFFFIIKTLKFFTYSLTNFSFSFQIILKETNFVLQVISSLIFFFTFFSSYILKFLIHIFFFSCYVKSPFFSQIKSFFFSPLFFHFGNFFHFFFLTSKRERALKSALYSMLTSVLVLPPAPVR